jgi:LytS/YehU family sensor histidine kinase
MKELDVDLDKSYIADTSDARHVFAENKGVFNLGIVILLTFAGVMVAVLFGSYQIMTGGITIKDVAIVATVSGLVGTVVGYVAANAQQVVSYFFGSSRGSADKTAAMATTITRLGTK